MESVDEMNEYRTLYAIHAYDIYAPIPSYRTWDVIYTTIGANKYFNQDFSHRDVGK